MNDILISIIVPVYNTEKYLEKCIESLISQSLKGIELIFVNDCSTDNSIDILRKYEQHYPNLVKVIDLPNNIKQGGARNVGINTAKGIYVGFVDSDDYVADDTYEKLYIAASSEDCDIAFCGYNLVDENYNIIKTVLRNGFDKSGSITNKNVKSQLIIGGGSVWSTIYKKQFLTDNNIVFPEKIFFEDNYFVSLVKAYANSFAYVNEPLYFYYQRQNSVVHQNCSKTIKDRIKVMDMLINELKTRGIYDDFCGEYDYLYIRSAYVNAAKACVYNSKPYDIKTLRYLRKRIKKIPKYYRNKFFIENYSLIEKIVLRINDFSPIIYSITYGLLYKIKKKWENK